MLPYRELYPPNYIQKFYVLFAPHSYQCWTGTRFEDTEIAAPKLYLTLEDISSEASGEGRIVQCQLEWPQK